MTKQELKSALETIIAARPIPTVYRCGSDSQIKDKFAHLVETDRGFRVVVESDWTTDKKAALDILWAIRCDLKEVADATLRGTKAATVHGTWHMGSFWCSSVSREFFPLAVAA